ncbi:SCO family protein [Piscinibacter gummiphilus]|uniref:SCO family protein n=1 Tax=Piscinibacter gummiphilus TaxID=946333 RepID=UPI0039B95EA1
MTTRRHTLIALAALLAGCDKLTGAKTGFKAIDITGADYGKALSLPDQDGKTRTLADFKGKVTVVFFGYTQCPDVCPTTMAELAQVKKALGADGDKVQGVFISVDPERDTPERLKAYMQGFDPSFIALRGTPEQTAAAAKDFRVYYSKVPGKTEGSYTMDHTAGSYIFDTTGRLRLFTRYGEKDGTANLTADIKALLANA